MEQLTCACEEKYLGKRRFGQQVKHFLSGDDVKSKIVAINNKIQLAYLQCQVSTYTQWISILQTIDPYGADYSPTWNGSAPHLI
jgi:hypothetical protein